MMQSLHSTLSLLCHMAGLVVLLYGAFVILGALTGRSGAGGYLKGGAIILIGAWLAGLAG